jgi:hypothetical protein
MADELQSDAMWIGDKEYHKGDLVEIEDEERREQLREIGALADEGTLKEKANHLNKIDYDEARRQRIQRGIGPDALSSDAGAEDQEEAAEDYEDKSTAHFEKSEAKEDEKPQRGRQKPKPEADSSPATDASGTAPAGRGRR